MRLRGRRIPLLLTLVVVVLQLAHTNPLMDVVTGEAPAGLSLAYPAMHVVFAPFTLLADWLNGESRRNIAAFVAWAALAWALVRLARGGTWKSEIKAGLGFLLGLGFFFAWATFATRAIPRLVVDRAQLPDALVWDAHSHSALSHDGRGGFGADDNARWHERAGFDAAFLTDHNEFGAVSIWRAAATHRGAALLDGEELSLFGLHLVVLGNTARLANEPMNHAWDSTLTLVRRLAGDSANDSLLLVASLPEYWEHHWGNDLGGLTAAGVRGFEIWTTSPAAMAIPGPQRDLVIARARLANLVVTGATDMHGLGHTASVWNVTELPGWRAMDGRTLERALVAHLLKEGFRGNRVVAMRRSSPISRIGQAFEVPAGLIGVVRRTTPAHAAALLGWVWLVALATNRRRRPTP